MFRANAVGRGLTVAGVLVAGIGLAVLGWNGNVGKAFACIFTPGIVDVTVT